MNAWAKILSTWFYFGVSFVIFFPLEALTLIDLEYGDILMPLRETNSNVICLMIYLIYPIN